MKINEIPTPAYVVDEQALEKNLRILGEVKKKAGCRILLAQKAFSMFAEYPLIRRYLDGATASGLFEARLGAEEMGGENHVFSPAYRPEEIRSIAALCDHVIFNSVAQLRRFGGTVRAVQQERGIRGGIGLRINPACSTQDHAIYDPCAPGSRLGVTVEAFRQALEEEPDFWIGLTGCIFIRFASRTAMRWSRRCRLWRKASAHGWLMRRFGGLTWAAGIISRVRIMTGND